MQELWLSGVTNMVESIHQPYTNLIPCNRTYDAREKLLQQMRQYFDELSRTTLLLWDIHQYYVIFPKPKRSLKNTLFLDHLKCFSKLRISLLHIKKCTHMMSLSSSTTCSQNMQAENCCIKCANTLMNYQGMLFSYELYINTSCFAQTQSDHTQYTIFSRPLEMFAKVTDIFTPEWKVHTCDESNLLNHLPAKSHNYFIDTLTSIKSIYCPSIGTQRYTSILYFPIAATESPPMHHNDFSSAYHFFTTTPLPSTTGSFSFLSSHLSRVHNSFVLFAAKQQYSVTKYDNCPCNSVLLF